MPQTYPYLVITDGIDTVTIQTGANTLADWQLTENGWTPAIAGVHRSRLAGRGQYADVEESITVDVIGTTAALCYANLETLARLLDKAERWWRKNEAIPPVLLKYAPQGSTIHTSPTTVLQAIVLGRAGNDELNGVGQPKNAGETGGVLFEIDGVEIVCRRRGSWIGASEAPASAAAVANPAVLTITLPSTATIPGPIELLFTGFTTSAGTGTVDIPPGFLMVGPNNSFSLQQGEAATTGGLAAGATYVSTADAAARASGGNVGKLNHNLSAIGAESVLTWTLPAAFLNSTRMGVYLTYRNNAAIVWTLRAEAFRTATALDNLNVTSYTTILAGPNNPTAIYLGALASRNGFDTLRLRAATVSGTGTPTIDFDTIVAVDFSSGLTYVLTQEGMQQTAIGAAFASKNAQIAVNFSPATLRDPEVRLDILTTAAVLPITASGDTALMANGSVVQAIWYATHLYNGATPYWTTQNNAGAAILSIGATVTRRLAYLTPQ